MEKVLEVLEQNNFSTEPPTTVEKTPSVNYLKSFELFAQSTIKPFSNNNLQSRPMSGLPSSQSTTTLKKTSLIRCKTAINRNTVSHSNLLGQNQVQRGSQGTSSNRGNNGFLKGNGKSVLQQIGN